MTIKDHLYSNLELFLSQRFSNFYHLARDFRSHTFDPHQIWSEYKANISIEKLCLEFFIYIPFSFAITTYFYFWTAFTCSDVTCEYWSGRTIFRFPTWFSCLIYNFYCAMKIMSSAVELFIQWSTGVTNFIRNAGHCGGTWSPSRTKFCSGRRACLSLSVCEVWKSANAVSFCSSLWTHTQRCVHVIFCRCFFFIFFILAALVGQTDERIFTKLSHVVDIRCCLRTY